MLYLKGKKFYNYGMVKSGLPPMRFPKGYMVDETEYRKRKQEAFREEKVSALEQRYKDRSIKMLMELHKECDYSYDKLSELIGMKPRAIQQLLYREGVRFAGKDCDINNNNLIQKDIMDGLIGGQEKNENN
jgi:predicted HTH domain antitoxin